MEPDEEQELGEELGEADLAESEDAGAERGGWTETESPPHEGEEGQDLV